jgi:putative NIF3 family GTP cyclohydrolase 1 type 2
MSLIKKLKMIFDIPYVDFVGKNLKKITKVGIVAGGGDEVEYMQTVCEKGAQAYITGEIFSHYDNEWGRQNTLKIQKYSEAVGMSMIGVSHGASEYLVMKTQIPEWLRKKFTISIIPISQSVWWM